MKYFNLRIMGLVLVIGVCFVFFHSSKTENFFNFNAGFRRVRDNSIWRAIVDLEAKKGIIEGDEEFEELVTQIYFDRSLSVVSVAERTKFILEAYNLEQFPIINGLLIYLQDKYELSTIEDNILKFSLQQMIEKEVKVLESLHTLSNNQCSSLEFAVDIIFGLLPEEVANVVIPNYDIGKVKMVKKLEGGFFNKPLMVETEKGKYVIREERVHTTPKSLECVDSVIQELRRNEWPAAEMLHTKEGQRYIEYKSRKFTVYEYGEGYVLDLDERISKQRLINIAQTLARFHEIMEDFIPEGSVENVPIINTERKREAFDTAIAQIQRLEPSQRNEVENFLLENYDFIMEQLDVLENNLRALGYNSLPKSGAIWGDPARKNIILQGDEVVLGFDWDHLTLNETRVYDVVWAMFSFAFKKMENIHLIESDGPEFEDALLFLMAYQEVNPLSEAEIKIIPEIHRAILLEFLSWTAKPYKRVSMQNPESLAVYKNIVEALKKINSINWGKLLGAIQE
jgi:Ser/Thr protein kinase RdoA (MazF antagonist)